MQCWKYVFFLLCRSNKIELLLLLRYSKIDMSEDWLSTIIVQLVIVGVILIIFFLKVKENSCKEIHKSVANLLCSTIDF